MLGSGSLVDQKECDEYKQEKDKCKWYRPDMADHCDFPEFKLGETKEKK